MPLRKYCASPGCNKVIDINKTYCSKHTVTKAQRNKEYDTKYRDQKAKAFYNSKAWRLTREMVLARDQHIDVYLYATQKRIVRATLVHHIVEYKEDTSKALVLDNLISVSEETHEKIIKRMYSKEETKRQMQEELKQALKFFREFKA